MKNIPLLKSPCFFILKKSKIFILMLLGFVLITSLYAKPRPSICVNFQAIPTKKILQFMAKSASRNLVIDQKITGNTTLNLCHISWDQLLKTLLLTQNLAKETIDGITYILPFETLLQHEKQLKTQQQEEPMELSLITLKYAKAHQLAGLLKAKLNGPSSKESYVSADNRTNSLIINTQHSKLKAIKKLIYRMDQPIPQVLIEARIVNIDHDHEKTLGLKFNLSNKVSNPKDQKNEPQESSSPLSLSFATHSINTLGMATFKLDPHILLDLELSALESEGKAEIISSPRLLTANQQTATIEAGEEIPYQESTNQGGTTTTFKKAVLKLQVTPRITSNHKISLHLKVNQDKRGNKEVLGVPTIDTRQLDTQIIAENGQTIVLGGIYEYTQATGESHTPFLADIPILGVLFKQHKSINTRRELLIFVTPKIVTTQHAATKKHTTQHLYHR
jgi:type IV pilus assembly protein PilQ